MGNHDGPARWVGCCSLVCQSEVNVQCYKNILSNSQLVESHLKMRNF